MPDSFQRECDRLSDIVDHALFERLQWERNEGPILAKLVVLARGAFEQRPEFELAEEGATRDLKRFVLKIYSKRVMAISMWIEDGRAMLQAERIERSPYGLADAAPVTAECAAIDESWMIGALQQQFRRIQAPAG